MAQEDFDIERLAAYLHLRPEQVLRLVERGKLPGRRVAGQWRFSPAEIHHWWEERIGLADDTTLAEAESVLQHADESESFSLAELLPESAIALPLEARTRHSVISGMVNLAAQTGWLWDEEKMIEAVKARENLHPTALDNGVALLHPRRPLAAILAQPFLAFGRTTAGIPFGGTRVLTDLFFLICSQDDRGHLRVLARLSRLIGDSNFLMELRSAATAREVVELISQHEANLPE